MAKQRRETIQGLLPGQPATMREWMREWTERYFPNADRIPDPERVRRQMFEWVPNRFMEQLAWRSFVDEFDTVYGREADTVVPDTYRQSMTDRLPDRRSPKQVERDLEALLGIASDDDDDDG